MGGPPAWGLGLGLTTRHYKKIYISFTKFYEGPRNWTDSFDKRPKLRKIGDENIWTEEG
jgi:hypothetical protein